MSLISVRSTAKLNLTLKIAGVRPDGYHLLDSLFCAVDLHDALILEPAPAEFETVCAGASIPDNLTTRAARLFYQTAGLPGGCRIRLEKRIPIEAGLGGGSGDAAAVLRALNAQHGALLSDDQLGSLALLLGADVPFALKGGLARVRGIGEQCTSLPLPHPLHFVIAKPSAGLSTQQMFAAYDAAPVCGAVDNDAFYRALCSLNGPALRGAGGNDLQPAAERAIPEIERLRTSLYSEGALYAAMTGSGSAVFGLFPDQAAAKRACRALARLVPFCVCCRSLGGPA